MRRIPALVATLAASSAFAHPAHGQAGTHWHASDTAGLLLVGVLAALAIWFSRAGR